MTSRLLLALLFSSVFVVPAGCSTPTVVTLNSGREIQAVDTSHYNRSSGFYGLEQLDGKHTRVNKGRVRSVKDM